MIGRRNEIVAREGLPLIALAALGCVASLHFLPVAYALVPILLVGVLYLVFRDPRRAVPAAPLGVVSPVDGQVVAVDQSEDGVLPGPSKVITIRVNSLGTYTARAPVEGKIQAPRPPAGDTDTAYRGNALWLQTDEGDEVVLQFSGHRPGLAPKSLLGIGERAGQGQRCAYLRLTRFARLHLPGAGKVLVEPGQTVVAGSDLVGKLPPPRV